jgi:hypothetical protein
MAKEILGDIDVDAVARWRGRCGGKDSPDAISRGPVRRLNPDAPLLRAAEPPIGAATLFDDAMRSPLLKRYGEWVPRVKGI